jgi:hypothetical protein
MVSGVINVPYCTPNDTYKHQAMSMSLSSMLASSSLLLSLLAVLSLFWIAVRVRRLLRHDLRDLPGPFLAKFSGLYRLFMVGGGNAPAGYRKLHQQYGPIVRVGPNHVAVSDPSTIPVIYGLGSKFMKVRIIHQSFEHLHDSII